MLDKWISKAILAGVISSAVSIFVSEIFFSITVVLWIADCCRRREFRLKVPPFFPAMLGFFLATVIAIVFSSDAAVSATYLKKFVKFFYVFFVFTYVSRDQIEPALRAVFLVLGASAAFGVLQYFWLMDVNLVNRIEGFMGHWMTFSGQLMLGSVALAGYILFSRLPLLDRGRDEGRTGEETEPMSFAKAISTLGPWLGLLAILLFALVLTHTRNAWLGTMGGLFVLLWLYRGRWVAGGLACVLVIFIALPDDFKHRLYSSFDPSDTTTRIRIELLETGKNIILSHPWTGVGPGMVSRRYQEYNSTDEFPSWIYQHLHNNAVHIAAEMGTIALAIWLLLWMWLLKDFAHFARAPDTEPIVSGVAVQGIGVVVAFLLAGLLEYNFGDSEILILLLFFVTAPYVVQPGREAPA